MGGGGLSCVSHVGEKAPSTPRPGLWLRGRSWKKGPPPADAFSSPASAGLQTAVDFKGLESEGHPFGAEDVHSVASAPAEGLPLSTPTPASR